MNIFLDIVKEGFKLLGILILVLIGCLILATPIFIGLAMNNVIVVLFGVLFFAAFATAIFSKAIELRTKNDRT